jgi:malonyl CoA-acyl carrier protein transacylase
LPRPQHIITHPKGLLFATQFALIALAVTSRAAFEGIRSKGLVQPDAAFAGHSLGDSALAFVANILPNSSLINIVFYRDLTMQHAVERDEQGCSNYVPSILAVSARHSMTQPLVRLSTPSRMPGIVY